MRKQPELRSVIQKETPRKGESATAPTTSATPIERSFLSTLNEMERWFEESVHRPFMGLSWMPLRHLFREAGSYGDITPAVDVFEEGKFLVVKAELPGMKKDEVNVRLVDNNLIISGEKKSEEKVQDSNYLRLERAHGTFTRTLSMPEGIDFEGAKASFKDGVLEIRIPRTGEAGAVRQIPIQ